MQSKVETSLDYSELYGLDRDHSINTKPYILSNESNRDLSARELRVSAPTSGAFHIGFSCWENFDLMVARNSCGGLIADISNEMHGFHQITQRMVLSSSNREEFVAQMLAFLSETPSFFREEKAESLNAIHKELFRSGSWLNTEESFQKIRSLYQARRIIHIRMDIMDRRAFQAIADWMRANGLHCDSLYLSNIPDSIQNGEDAVRGMGKLKMAVNCVVCTETFVIHASERFAENTGMPQRVYQSYPYDPAKSMMESKQ